VSGKIKCFHCGDDCGKYPVIFEEKNFCCHGCRTVFEILNTHKLYKYYELEESPGIKPDNDIAETRFSFLDNDEIIEKIIEFDAGGISRVVFSVPSIHCASCIWLLENLNKINRFIISSTVNFTRKELIVVFQNQELSLRKLAELLARINYPPHFSFEQLDKKQSKTTNRNLIIKLGVAGFMFGNIMLFSMPYYVPGKELVEEPFKNFFTWLNMFLCLPVVFFCGFDYLKSGFKNIYYRFIDINLPIAIGILAILFQSIYETISTSGHGYYDSLSGLIFFLLIGKWYQDKTYKALSFERDYKSYFPIAVTKISNGKEESVPINKILPGDEIMIRNQELIPADGILQSDVAYIDYSFVSGESKPVKVERNQKVFAGGKQTGSHIVLKINKMVNQSRLTELWNQENFKDAGSARLVKLLDKVSKNFTLIILLIAASTFIYWYFTDPAIAVKASTAVLIVACPCALALSVPFAFGNMMRLFGRYGFYLKKSDIVEKLQRTDTIVFDKTGTLTEQDRGSITFTGQQPNELEKEMIYLLTKNSTHPYSLIIAGYYSEYANSNLEISDFMEIPSAGLKAKINGINFKLGSAEFVGENDGENDINASRVWLMIDDHIKGYFNIKAKYRDGLNEIISNIKEKYELHIISGDNDSELENLKKIFPSSTHFNFNMSPAEKLDYIRKLKNRNKKVLMIGDGLNDAGALRESYAGISIADSVYHFSPACDAILEASKFNKLSFYLKTSKSTVRIVKTSFLISFIYNFAGLSFAVQGLLTPIIAAVLMPLSSVTVVGYVVLLTGLFFKIKFK